MLIKDENVIAESRRWLLLLHSGNATEQQLLQFKQWLTAASIHQQVFRDMEVLWRQTKHTHLAETHISEQCLSQSDCAGKEPKHRWKHVVTGLAACLVVCLSLVINWPPEVAPTPSIYQTVQSEIKRFELQDGTVVTLGADSKISVSYYEDKRSVEQIKGDVLYEVTHNERAPFTVRLNKVSVTVLGTIFEIQKYHDSARVNLASGKVLVANENSSVNLNNNQGVTIPQHGDVESVESISQDSFADWRRLQFSFQDIPMKDLVETINRYSQQTVRLSHPSLQNRLVTVSFHIDQVAQVLDALKVSHQLNWYKDSNGVIWLAL